MASYVLSSFWNAIVRLFTNKVKVSENKQCEALAPNAVPKGNCQRKHEVHSHKSSICSGPMGTVRIPCGKRNAAVAKLVKDREERKDSRSVLYKQWPRTPKHSKRSLWLAQRLLLEHMLGPVISAVQIWTRWEWAWEVRGSYAFTTGQGDSCVSWQVEKPFTWLSAVLTQGSWPLRTAKTKTPWLWLWGAIFITTDEVNRLASPQPAAHRLACSWLKYLEECGQSQAEIKWQPHLHHIQQHSPVPPERRRGPVCEHPHASGPTWAGVWAELYNGVGCTLSESLPPLQQELNSASSQRRK